MIKRKLKVGILGFGIALLTTLNVNAQSQNGQQRKERPTIEELIKEMDKNEDAKLSMEEVKGPLKKDFDKIDADEDGFLTAEELKNAPKPKGREERE
ncbi:MAG: EF-hand domain-containing protein [Algibacter sp.]|uniref:EF-hand domain-containing protein n=1 Tax=Algibacter sp. TaxID=1872428 RepID=UPI003297C90A